MFDMDASSDKWHLPLQAFAYVQHFSSNILVNTISFWTNSVQIRGKNADIIEVEQDSYEMLISETLCNKMTKTGTYI